MISLKLAVYDDVKISEYDSLEVFGEAAVPKLVYGCSLSTYLCDEKLCTSFMTKLSTLLSLTIVCDMWISAEAIAPAAPHWPLDKAMVALCSRDF